MQEAGVSKYVTERKMSGRLIGPSPYKIARHWQRSGTMTALHLMNDQRRRCCDVARIEFQNAMKIVEPTLLCGLPPIRIAKLVVFSLRQFLPCGYKIRGFFDGLLQ